MFQTRITLLTYSVCLKFLSSKYVWIVTVTIFSLYFWTKKRWSLLCSGFFCRRCTSNTICDLVLPSKWKLKYVFNMWWWNPVPIFKNSRCYAKLYPFRNWEPIYSFLNGLQVVCITGGSSPKTSEWKNQISLLILEHLKNYFIKALNKFLMCFEINGLKNLKLTILRFFAPSCTYYSNSSKNIFIVKTPWIHIIFILMF